MATTTISQEVATRKTRAKVTTTFARDLAEALRTVETEATAIRWPSTRWQDDPVGFARDILGVEPWSKQVEILEAVRDHKRVAVSSGHKTGKSHSAAIIALWYYCSWPDARVVMSSTTSRQVDQILWRELKMQKSRAGKCLKCRAADPAGRKIAIPCPHSALITGEMHELARSGLKSHDFREVVGFTAREAEAVAGISGPNLLYVIDEASGVHDLIFEAIEGNRAGGARIVMFSNPTRTEGEFFAAFNDKANLYKTIRVSSEETPNVVSGERVIPGLATREWIDEKREEWGEDSPIYKVRVKGEFVTKEEGKIIALHDILQAQIGWLDATGEGRLYLGIDPAGPGGQGDESVFVLRRGYKMIGMWAYHGLTEDDHVSYALQHLRALRNERERCVAVVDREGPIGSRVYGMMRASAEMQAVADVRGVRSSDKAARQPNIYGRVRDELWANLAAWIRDGGTILDDSRLEKELHAPSWSTLVTGLLKVTAKEELRKMLKRSPDRADALALAVWEVSRVSDDVEDGIHDDADEREAGGDLLDSADPYGGALNPWG